MTTPIARYRQLLAKEHATEDARTPLQKLAKMALDNPELKADLVPLIRQYAAGGGPNQITGSAHTQITGPPTTTIYENDIDHGYDQPLAGGTDVMKRLQDELLIEQGSEPREKNPRLAATLDLQQGLIALINGPGGRKVAKAVVMKYAADTDTTVVVNAAVEDIINNAVALALDPQRMGRVIAQHTAREGE